MFILTKEEEEMKKKITIEGWVSELTEVGDIIITTTDGKLDFNDSDAIYKDIGNEKDWGTDEWPPKKVTIEIIIED